MSERDFASSSVIYDLLLWGRALSEPGSSLAQWSSGLHAYSSGDQPHPPVLPQCAHGSQRMTCGVRVSPSTIWVPKVIRLGSQGLRSLKPTSSIFPRVQGAQSQVTRLVWQVSSPAKPSLQAPLHLNTPIIYSHHLLVTVNFTLVFILIWKCKEDQYSSSRYMFQILTVIEGRWTNTRKLSIGNLWLFVMWKCILKIICYFARDKTSLWA